MLFESEQPQQVIGRSRIRVALKTAGILFSLLLAVGLAIHRVAVATALPVVAAPKSISALLVPENARSVVYRNGVDGCCGVTYQIDERYPAEDFLAGLEEHLQQLDWTQLDDDWWSPGSRSLQLRGWSQFKDATVRPPNDVYHWMAQWQSTSGSVVCYSMKYQYPAGASPDLRTLYVAAVWTPAKTVRRDQKEARYTRVLGNFHWLRAYLP